MSSVVSEESSDAQSPSNAPNSNASNTTNASSSSEEQEDKKNGVLFRARVTPTLLAVNVIVGVVLCAGIGAFLGVFILDRPILLTGIGLLLGLSGFRTRTEPDEILPATIERAPDESAAVCTFFSKRPSEKWSAQQIAHVDAEATGTYREGFVHWVILRNKLVPPVVTKIRLPNRKQAVTLAHELRELLGVKPLHELGDDEPGGLALPEPAATMSSVVTPEKPEEEQSKVPAVSSSATDQ